LSDVIKVSSGVPQCGHSSPLLFISFTDDISLDLKYFSHLSFADDLKLYCPIYNIEDCNKLKYDINTFSDWCLKNDLEINVSKCSQILFSSKKCKTTNLNCLVIS